MSVRTIVGAALLTAACQVPATALAQSSGGDASTALPGLARVGVVETPETQARLSLAASAGYARTEAQPGDAGPHHRAFGSVAAGVVPISFLAVALRLDGRIDVHPDDEHGSDETFVGEPRLVVRGGTVIDGVVGAGAEVGVWAPGGEAPSFVPEAVSFEGALLGSYRFAEIGVTVAARLGYRRDRSAKAVPDPSLVRQGDRIGLASSDFDALLLGAGALLRRGVAEAFAELTWDVLLGERAPPATSAPLRLTAGARVAVTEGLSAELSAEWVPTARPELGIGRPLAPIEPRWAIAAGVRIRLPLAEAPAAQPRSEPRPPERTRTEPPPVEPLAAEPPVEPPSVVEDPERPATPSGSLRGLVRSYDGNPVEATVRIEPEGTEFTTGEDGTFEFELQPGTYTVSIRADGFYEQRRRVVLEEDGVTVLNADLRRRGRRRGGGR